MFNWRIAKYNPLFRDVLGNYTKSEWTSASDIGKSYEDGTFAIDDYLCIENKYIAAISWFMDCMQISRMKITCLEKWDISDDSVFNSKEILQVLCNVKNNQTIEKEFILNLSCLVLREYVWCKFESKDMYIHFGYDYYMYIGSLNSCNNVRIKVQEEGLFVEEFKFPYLDDK